MLFYTCVQAQAPDRMAAPLTEAVRQRRGIDSTFYAIEPKTQFRVAVTPERLREIHDVRSPTHEAAGRSKRVATFLLALERSRLTPLGLKDGQKRPAYGGVDARYGLAVADGAGRSLFWICTNAEGDLAVVDSRAYRLSGPVSAWFRNEGRRLRALKRAGKKP